MKRIRGFVKKFSKELLIVMFVSSVLAIFLLNVLPENRKQQHQLDLHAEAIENLNDGMNMMNRTIGELVMRLNDMYMSMVETPADSFPSNSSTEPQTQTSISSSDYVPKLTPVPELPQIVIQMPEQDTGFDWKHAISWFLAAMNGIVLFWLNIKKIKKT